MTNVNRRSFIWQTTAGGAVIALAAALPGRLNQVAAPQESIAPMSANVAAEPLVAYVRNVAAGEIALLVGTREIVVRDAELVRRLLKAAG